MKPYPHHRNYRAPESNRLSLARALSLLAILISLAAIGVSVWLSVTAPCGGSCSPVAYESTLHRRVALPPCTPFVRQFGHHTLTDEHAIQAYFRASRDTCSGPYVSTKR